MKFIYQYQTDAERQDIIEKNTEKVLIEERNILEGNYLIFVDIAEADLLIQLVNENERLKKSQAEQDEIIMNLILGGV